MVKFSLIRHAKTRWNLEKKLQGREDISLAPEGISQVKKWANDLKEKDYDLILSSPMIRAQQTAQIIGEINNLEVEVDENLREQDFGNWEGKKIKEIRDQTPGEIEFQESKGWKFCPPNGESRIHVLQRALKAFESAAKRFEDKNILVVSHSSVIKSLVYKLLGRKFLPGEPVVLKDYHLHELKWEQSLEIEKVNSMKLS